MVALTSQERLQPSLLDRLTDHQPQSTQEAVADRVLTKKQLREAVLRDLGWLFNTTMQEPPPDTGDVDRLRMWLEAPDARDSVVNFGIPSLSGLSISYLDFPRLEQAIRQAIVRFEPRIDPATLTVKISNDFSTGIKPTSLRLVIKGQMWNQPVPLELLLSADVDVDTGQTSVRDMR